MAMMGLCYLYASNSNDDLNAKFSKWSRNKIVLLGEFTIAHSILRMTLMCKEFVTVIRRNHSTWNGIYRIYVVVSMSTMYHGPRVVLDRPSMATYVFPNDFYLEFFSSSNSFENRWSNYTTVSTCIEVWTHCNSLVIIKNKFVHSCHQSCYYPFLLYLQILLSSLDNLRPHISVYILHCIDVLYINKQLCKNIQHIFWCTLFTMVSWLSEVNVWK